MKKRAVLVASVIVIVAIVTVIVWRVKANKVSDICERKNAWNLQQYPADHGGGGGKGPVAYDAAFETTKCSTDGNSFAIPPQPSN